MGEGRRFCLAIAIPWIVFSLLVVDVGRTDAAQFRYRPRSNVSFHGVSTIRNWTCDTVPVSGRLELPFRIRSGEDLLSKLEGFEPEGRLRIPVRKINCGESGFFDHNQNLRQTLKASEYSHVTFDPILTRNVRRDSGVRATVDGALTITDATRRTAVPLRITVADSETLRVQGEFTVSLKEYGLSPPRLLLGMISIYDTVRISVDLYLFPDRSTGRNRPEPEARTAGGTRP